MIDSEGYRPNVGIIVCNSVNKVLWARRIGQNAWQFPQGGINRGEDPVTAMYRELFEEVGLLPEHVELLATTRGWLRYRLPRRYVRKSSGRPCIGQKQKWYLLRLTSPESCISFSAAEKPEFDGWQWVNYWYPVTKVVDFKQEVYRLALRELSPFHTELERRNQTRP